MQLLSHSIIFLSIARAIPVYRFRTNTVSLPTESGFSWHRLWVHAQLKRKHIHSTKTQDVHLVFLNLRWSSCVALIFSLLTTSSCLLFLLDKCFKRLNNLLIYLSLFNTDHCVSWLSLPLELGISALIIQCLIKKKKQQTLLLPAREKTYPASGNTQWEKEDKCKWPFCTALPTIMGFKQAATGQRRLSPNLSPYSAPRNPTPQITHWCYRFGLLGFF